MKKKKEHRYTNKNMNSKLLKILSYHFFPTYTNKYCCVFFLECIKIIISSDVENFTLRFYIYKIKIDLNLGIVILHIGIKLIIAFERFIRDAALLYLKD